MHDEIIQELIKVLSLSLNRCFNKISTINNQLIIENSNYNGSSIYVGRELLEIESKLVSYEKYLDIELSLEKIVIEFK